MSASLSILVKRLAAKSLFSIVLEMTMKKSLSKIVLVRAGCWCQQLVIWPITIPNKDSFLGSGQNSMRNKRRRLVTIGNVKKLI